jgi:hypothetical protein
MAKKKHNYPTGVTRDKKSGMDIVAQLLRGELREEHLSDWQAEFYRRVRGVYGLMLSGHPQTQLVEYIQGEFDISYATAWRLYKDVGELFGAEKANKNIKRQIAENMAQRTYKFAEELGDVKMMIQATKAYNQAAGLDRDDYDLPDFSLLEAPPVILVLPEETEAALAALLQKGAIDLNKFQQDNTIEIDHEEVD